MPNVPTQGRKEEARTASRRSEIDAARKAGETWAAIAETQRLSITRCQNILRGDPRIVNPENRLRSYQCGPCGNTWKTRAKMAPIRCPYCGSHKWRR